MQQSTQLAALLVALCSGHTLAGGGAHGNNTAGANYTALAAQLSALRLSNSSNSSANSSARGQSRSLQPVSSGLPPGRAAQRGHSKKTASVAYGKKGRPHQAAPQPPSHQRHNSSSVPPRSPTAHNSSRAGGHSGKVCLLYTSDAADE